MKEERERRIKLFCPSLSKVVQLVTRDDQKLNLGSIAHTFGLQPSTLKLNGHFISRGVDLIASSVTWKSLISFFSSRGLSTGIDGSGILVVDGKLSKPGSKRTHDSAVIENEIPSTSDLGYDSASRKPQLEDINLLNKKRWFRDSELDTSSDGIIKCNAFSLKRKQYKGDVCSPKRIHVDETSLGMPLGYQRRESSGTGSPSKAQFPCSFRGVNMKRMREDEMVVPASCKKIR